MKTHIKLLYGLSITFILVGFLLIYTGILLMDRDVTGWGIVSLLLSVIMFIAGETEHHKPPFDQNPYSL